eukprot:6471544-Amphidinium_carterae.3
MLARKPVLAVPPPRYSADDATLRKVTHLQQQSARDKDATIRDSCKMAYRMIRDQPSHLRR